MLRILAYTNYKILPPQEIFFRIQDKSETFETQLN